MGDTTVALRLTDKVARDTPAPEKGYRITYDSDLPGFGLRVTAAGAKSFILNYRHRGTERRLTIGSFPSSWSAAQARQRAGELRRKIDQGGDPLAERVAQRTAPTIATLAEDYLAKHIAQRRSNTQREARSILRQHILPKLGKLHVADVTREDIERFHRAISKTPSRANRALAILSTMFNLSIHWKMRGDNPCRGIQKNPEHGRERYLTPDELARLMAALAEHPNQTGANAVRLLLLTGSRKSEVLGATWNEFDLTAGVWTKPAATTKQNKTHRVPLSVPARQLLAAMHDKAHGPALFPGRGASGTQGDLRKTWRGVCKVAGITGVRLHDLRHSYASFLVGAGLSLPIIGALLGHSSPATTQRYAHLMDEPLRAATERVGAIVEGASGDKTAEVVVMPKRGTA